MNNPLSLKNTHSVSIARCRDYEATTIKSSLAEILKPLGGMNAFVKPGQRVALKPNILMAAAPERCICTHPQLVKAVGDLVKEAGGKPFIIDSPGAAIPHKKSSLVRVYEKCGYAGLGIDMNEDEEYEFIPTRKGRIVKKVEICKPLLEADAIINLPKVKTHSFMILTCAVKNMFGAVPGLLKIGYHSKLTSPDQFGAMLLDLLETVPPILNIVDGVQGMDGEGPSGGNPREMQVLLGSGDAVTLDYVVCKLIGFPPDKIPYLAIAQKEGICSKDLSEIEIISRESFESLCSPFQPPSTLSGQSRGGFAQRILPFVRPMLNYTFTLSPRVDPEKCVGCGACVRACPEKIIELEERKGKPIAHIKRKGCIHCYCCHEMCPHKAISLHKSLPYRLLFS